MDNAGGQIARRQSLAARPPRLPLSGRPLRSHCLYPDSCRNLPEVETIARGLHKRVRGDAIESVWIGSQPQTLKSPPAKIASTLEGKRIVRVRGWASTSFLTLSETDGAMRNRRKTEGSAAPRWRPRRSGSSTSA